MVHKNLREFTKYLKEDVLPMEYTSLFRNVSRQQFDKLFDTSDEHEVRTFIYKGLVFAFDGSRAIHKNAHDALGIKPVFDNNGWHSIDAAFTIEKRSDYKTNSYVYIIRYDQNRNGAKKEFQRALENPKFHKLFSGKRVYYKHEQDAPFIVEDGMAMTVGSGAVQGMGDDIGVPKKRKKRKVKLLRRNSYTTSVNENTIELHKQPGRFIRDATFTVFKNVSPQELKALISKHTEVRIARDKHTKIWYAWNAYRANHLDLALALYPEETEDGHYNYGSNNPMDRYHNIDFPFTIMNHPSGLEIVAAEFPEKTEMLLNLALHDIKFKRLLRGNKFEYTSPEGYDKPNKHMVVEDINDMFHFAGNKIFQVEPEFYHKCIMGKRRFERYENYVGKDDMGMQIREYGLKNPGKPIIVKNTQTGGMCYLRYGKYDKDQK